MSSKIATVLLFAAGAASPQTTDAFTGAWKLDVGKSKFTSNGNSYKGGTRTYEPVPGGTRVTYEMIHSDGVKYPGQYTVQCSKGKCTSASANWRQKGPRTVEGESFDNGKPDTRYVRTVSADGKTMTITFYPPAGAKKQPTSVQVWERQ